ncbi:MAG: hypothetical protein WAV30_01260 [Microgenomates group bacterium]
MKKINILALSILSLLAPEVYAAAGDVSGGLGFAVPNLAKVISFMVRFLFFFAGLAALLYLLLGAMAWVTSSGDKENVKKAQDKIQAAVVGLVILVAVLVILATMEQLVLKGAFCVGLTDCSVQDSIPKLLN